MRLLAMLGLAALSYILLIIAIGSAILWIASIGG